MDGYSVSITLDEAREIIKKQENLTSKNYISRYNEDLTRQNIKKLF